MLRHRRPGSARAVLVVADPVAEAGLLYRGIALFRCAAFLLIFSVTTKSRHVLRCL